MIPLLVAVIGGALVLLAAHGVRMLTSTGLESAAGIEQVRPERSDSPFYDTIETLGSRFVRLARSIYGPERLASLERLLRGAGRPGGLTQTKYLQRHAGFIVLGIVIAVLMSLNGQFLVGVGTALLFAAWMPLWIRLSARDRRAQIDRDLPDFLDVLSVTVNAGIPFRPALARVHEHHKGPLSEEIAIALDEMSLGVSRRAAFTGLRDRIGSEGVSTFVTALLQAEELGVPLADALTEISSEIRRERAQAVKQAAAKAASKVSLVVTTTIVPGSIILIVAVIILQNMEALQGVFG